MTSDVPDSNASSGDDLFDLPIEAVAASDIAGSLGGTAAERVEIPLAALPRRPAPAPAQPAPQPAMQTAPSAAPLHNGSSNGSTNPSSNADAILQQVRRRPKTVREPAPEVEEVAPPQVPASAATTRIPRGVWIGLGVLALVNLAVLAAVIARPGSGSNTSDPATTQVPTPASSIAEEPLPQTPKILDPLVPTTAAIEIARQVLRDARADIESGRRSSARARLGRLGLVIDGLDPANRESIRGEVALLIAESMQADADDSWKAKR